MLLSPSCLNRTYAYFSIVWTNLSPKLESYLTERRIEQAPIDLANRQVERRTSLVPFYESHLLTITDTEKYLLPPFYIILALDAFKQLWVPDDALISQATWDVAIQSGAIERLQREIKMSFYDAAVKSHELASIPIAAPAIEGSPTDAEMDVALALPTSIFSCHDSRLKTLSNQHKRTNLGCTTSGHYPFILQHYHEHHSGADGRPLRDAFDSSQVWVSVASPAFFRVEWVEVESDSWIGRLEAELELDKRTLELAKGGGGAEGATFSRGECRVATGNLTSSVRMLTLCAGDTN